MSRRPPSHSDSFDKPPSASDESAGGKKKNTLKKPSFWVSILTLLIIGGYTYFAHEQVTETQTANGIAKNALAEVNKPYVMLTGIYPNYTMDTNGVHLRLGFVLTNYGNTPAHFLRFTSCAPIIRSDSSPDIHCDKTSAPGDPTDLGPKQPVNISGEIVKEEDIDATKDAKTSVYVLGYVTYQDSIDVDENNLPEQRETRFCLKAVQTKTQTKQITVPNANQTAVTPAQVTGSISPEMLAAIAQATAPIVGQACPAFSCMDETCRPLPK